jgi:hypothetical protein
VSENPYGPPAPPPGGPGYLGYPPPPRRGWPSWLIVVVGVVSGTALAGASTVAVGLVASSVDTPSSSSSAAAPAGPSPGSSDPSGTPSQPDNGSLKIDFPDGSTGTFALPDGLHHDQADDDDGHVALQSDDDGAYLDVYTDETTASQARDLHLVAAQDATDDRNHGDKTTAITYRSVSGYQAAQYRFSHDDSSGTYDGLVTIVLVGSEQISLYWSDDADGFSASAAQQASAAVLHSLQVNDGGDSSSA